MSYTQYPRIPKGVVVLQPGGSFRAERTGLASQLEKFIGNYGDFISGVHLSVSGYENSTLTRSYRSAHPFYPSLLLFSAKITRGKGTLGILECEFRGLDPDLSAPPPPIYFLNRAGSNEPLPTHPNWSTTIAGTPDTSKGGPGPLNGAIFVDKEGNYNPATTAQGSQKIDPKTASFSGWGDQSTYVGAEDFLSPGAEWKQTYVDYSPPVDLGNVAAIETPDGPVPQVLQSNSYNWLYTGITFTDNAGLYRIERTWLLSGPKGWDKNIYPGPAALSPPGSLSLNGDISGGD